MLHRSIVVAVCLLLTVGTLPGDAWGRGFGGARGGFGGGARMGGGGARMGGGGFGGGARMGGGNFGSNLGGRGLPSGGGNFGGNFGGGGLNPAVRSGGGFGGNLQGGGLPRDGQFGGNFDGGGIGAGRVSDRGFGENPGSRFGSGDRFSAPSRSQVGNFLGLPSDEGFRSASGSGTGPRGNVDFNYGAAEGPRGGTIGGATATGPRDNTVGRVGGVGADGGAFRARGFEGAGGASGIQGAAVGPGGRVAAGGAVRGPEGYGAGRAAVAGANGVAAGFSRVTPSGRYAAAAGVRRGYDDWGIYGRGWYADHPGAWFAAGWGAGYAWNWATWDSVGAWMSYYPAQPVYYDYGTNVVYQGGSVYVDDRPVGTAEQYYDSAAQIAASGATQERSDGSGSTDDGAAAASSEDWLPLGVFALTQTDQPSNNLTLQLAVNKQGIVRGNFADSTTGTTQTVQGAVDKQTQRVAFTVGDRTDEVVETGIYNLTKDEAPVLIHYGKDRTEQWLLVRLKQPGSSNASD